MKVTDYKKPEETGLPAANVLIYKLENNETVIVRPSGTEPKVRVMIEGKDQQMIEHDAKELADLIQNVML